MNALGKMAAVLLITLLPGLASAIVTSSLLTASLSGPREVGGLTEFDLWIKTDNIPFSSTVLGDPIWSGGVTLAYDPNVVTFNSFLFTVSGVLGTPRVDPDPCNSLLPECIVTGITFDSASLPGPYQTQEVDVGGVQIGTFRFQYNGGEGELILGPDSSAPFLNGSIDTPDPKSLITEFEWGTARVVPLPLAAWLMLSGLGMLGAFGFRKSG